MSAPNNFSINKYNSGASALEAANANKQKHLNPSESQSSMIRNLSNL